MKEVSVLEMKGCDVQDRNNFKRTKKIIVSKFVRQVVLFGVCSFLSLGLPNAAFTESDSAPQAATKQQNETVDVSPHKIQKNTAQGEFLKIDFIPQGPQKSNQTKGELHIKMYGTEGSLIFKNALRTQDKSNSALERVLVKSAPVGNLTFQNLQVEYLNNSAQKITVKRILWKQDEGDKGGSFSQCSFEQPVLESGVAGTLYPLRYAASLKGIKCSGKNSRKLEMGSSELSFEIRPGQDGSQWQEKIIIGDIHAYDKKENFLIKGIRFGAQGTGKLRSCENCSGLYSQLGLRSVDLVHAWMDFVDQKSEQEKFEQVLARYEDFTQSIVEISKTFEYEKMQGTLEWGGLDIDENGIMSRNILQVSPLKITINEKRLPDGHYYSEVNGNLTKISLKKPYKKPEKDYAWGYSMNKSMLFTGLHFTSSGTSTLSQADSVRLTMNSIRFNVLESLHHKSIGARHFEDFFMKWFAARFALFPRDMKLSFIVDSVQIDEDHSRYEKSFALRKGKFDFGIADNDLKSDFDFHYDYSKKFKEQKQSTKNKSEEELALEKFIDQKEKSPIQDAKLSGSMQIRSPLRNFVLRARQFFLSPDASEKGLFDISQVLLGQNLQAQIQYDFDFGPEYYREFFQGNIAFPLLKKGQMAEFPQRGEQRELWYRKLILVLAKNFVDQVEWKIATKIERFQNYLNDKHAARIPWEEIYLFKKYQLEAQGDILNVNLNYHNGKALLNSTTRFEDAEIGFQKMQEEIARELKRIRPKRKK